LSDSYVKDCNATTIFNVVVVSVVG